MSSLARENHTKKLIEKIKQMSGSWSTGASARRETSLWALQALSTGTDKHQRVGITILLSIHSLRVRRECKLEKGRHPGYGLIPYWGVWGMLWAWLSVVLEVLLCRSTLKEVVAAVAASAGEPENGGGGSPMRCWGSWSFLWCWSFWPSCSSALLPCHSASLAPPAATAGTTPMPRSCLPKGERCVISAYVCMCVRNAIIWVCLWFKFWLFRTMALWRPWDILPINDDAVRIHRNIHSDSCICWAWTG